MAEVRRFPYKGRRLATFEASGGQTLITYEADQQVINNIKTKYGENFIYGNTVYVAEYPKGSNKLQTVPNGPAGNQDVLGGISNVDLVASMNNDPNFHKTATGNTTGNTSSDPSNPDQQGGSTPTSEPNQTQKPVAQRLTYPSYIRPDQDRIKFQACEINPRGGSLINTPQYTKVGSPVFMAIQAPISDQNSVAWGPDNVNAIDNFVYGKSYEFIKKGTFNFPEDKDIIGALDRNTDYIQKFLAGKAASLNNVLARTDNIVLNPNLELLFQEPQLRPFSFQFKMSARDKEEAKQIRAIIRYFKKNMAVKNEGGLFLKAPNVFTIQYLKGTNTPHKGINTISPKDDQKACALTNCSVDYTPLGSYMTYNDEAGTMVAYTLSLQFQELTPIYDKDYDKIAEDAIGY